MSNLEAIKKLFETVGIDVHVIEVDPADDIENWDGKVWVSLPSDVVLTPQQCRDFSEILLAEAKVAEENKLKRAKL